MRLYKSVDYDYIKRGKMKLDSTLAKYRQRLASELNLTAEPVNQKFYSEEYQKFRDEYLPKFLSFYEKGCNFSEKILKVSPDPKTAESIQDSIETAHLQISPIGVASFSILMPIVIIFSGIILGSIISFIALPSGAVPLGTIYMAVFFIIAGVLSMLVMNRVPIFIANNWRLKASNQMVVSIFYIVTFMRHTSNLEGALRFASDHLVPPLSLDFKRILWEVQTEKFPTIKESLDNYLEYWRETNAEFVEAMHLIEGSLYEGSENRRISLLDKSLDVILNGTYEKMMHFAHDLKSPITILYMLGLILPILFLVILPLVVSFLTSGTIHPLFLVMVISSGYNFALPLIVFLLGKNILSTRPTGYGDSNMTENNPDYKKYSSLLIKIGKSESQINPLWVAIVIAIPLLFIGLSPLILGQILTQEELLNEEPFFMEFQFLGYKMTSVREGALTDLVIGPYGLGSSVISLSIILGLGLGFGLYYKWRSKKLMEIRKRTKKLENEFASGLFQLGNRLGDGIPAEIAFTKVALSMKGSTAGDFMELVSRNITQLGMNLQNAIFHPKKGAIAFFPSNLIQSSMKVLVQSSKKGPKVASNALINISRYIKEIHSVNERLRDLLADIVSSMNSQIKFLAPAIAGIVVGITTMVITILGQLSKITSRVTEGQESTVAGFADFTSVFGDGVPGFYFQTIIGLYILQIVYILSSLVNGIQNGTDPINEKFAKGTNLVKTTILYVVLSGTVMILFNFIAMQILTGFNG
jgi:hypothetical protein